MAVRTRIWSVARFGDIECVSKRFAIRLSKEDALALAWWCAGGNIDVSAVLCRIMAESLLGLSVVGVNDRFAVSHTHSYIRLKIHARSCAPMSSHTSSTTPCKSVLRISVPCKRHASDA